MISQTHEVAVSLTFLTCGEFELLLIIPHLTALSSENLFCVMENKAFRLLTMKKKNNFLCDPEWMEIHTH